MPPDAQDRLPRYFLLADDFGCFLAHPSVARGRIYPLRPDITDERVAGDLREYAKAGILVLYQGPDGRQYGWFPNWATHQRPPRGAAKRKCPEPPANYVAQALPGTAGQSQTVSGSDAAQALPGTAGQSPPYSQSSSSSSSLSSTSVAVGEPAKRADEPPAPPASRSLKVVEQKLLEFLRHEWPDIPATEAALIAWSEAYPGVDLLAEAKKARAHLVSSGEKREVPAAFLNGWFKREARGLPIEQRPGPRKNGHYGPRRDLDGSRVVPDAAETERMLAAERDKPVASREAIEAAKAKLPASIRARMK